MVMLVGYFDDSGVPPDRRVAAVAGHIGTVEAWKRFAGKWQQLLDQNGVKVMHRTDLESFEGEFSRQKGWTEERKRTLLTKAHELIRQHTLTGIGTSVLRADYEKYMTPFLKRKYGGVYGWCAHECIISVAKWCEITHRKGPVDWVFEQGTAGAGQVLTMFRELQKDSEFELGNVSFGRKRLYPLQSADVIAYETYKQTENQILDQGKRAVRFSLKQLLRPAEAKYFQYWDAKRIQDWISRVHARGMSTTY